MADEQNNQSTEQATQAPNIENAAPAPAPTETPAPAPVETPAAPAAPAPAPATPVKPATPAFNFPPAAAKPTVKPTAPVVKKTAVEAAAPAFDAAAVIAEAQAQASTTGRIALQQLADYIVAMAPRNIMLAETGARNQVGLYRAITRMINTLEGDFDLVFTTFLRVFAANPGGVFSEHQVFRFMETIALPTEDIKAFQRLLNLLQNVADPRGRQAGLKMTDFNKTLEFGITDAGRSRVLGYFNK